MNRNQRLGLTLLIILVSVSLDQVTKSIVKAELVTAPVITLLNDMVQIAYVANPGAILGLGAELPQALRLGLMAVFVAAVLGATVVYGILSEKATPLGVVGLALVSAGGIGNLIDRIVNGGWVVDFIQLRLGFLHTGVFNLADVSLFAGLLLLLFTLLQPEKKDLAQPEM